MVPRIIMEINIQSQAEELLLLACTCISAMIIFNIEVHKLCLCCAIILPAILKHKGSLKEPLSFAITIPQKEYVDFNTPDFVEEYPGLH